ncbi:DUF72 domain-containing protein [Pseudobdellovibrio exovorus]|uniref:DUF72 domain-containing protein n=1 Tax=Pseudobdellovibrio exovorus JSS TaxID=1184267 RepID=M4V573_9BACT|nr:DUF72 domain-containing protein [Pseudobdellovibrio exovorus]AGH94338.1 hypothetical protein A11Q_118 [Pseudobdellovibrio exovorus JSS]
MEFGKLQDVSHVDWTLPLDSELSLRFVRQQAKVENTATEYRLGTPAWAHKEWVGLIYPPKTSAADYLYHYSRAYGSIELNTSHYRIPSAEQTAKWRSQVPADFLFCSKVFQEISHRRHGLSDRGLLSTWYDYLKTLENNRGPSFIQFPPHFDYNSKALLFQFLKQWPDDFELALELRHPSWLQDRQILPALTEYLQTRRIGLVITDVAGRRDLLHTSISSDFTMIRFIGNDLHPSDTTRMADWAERLKAWSDEGLKRVFFFVHEPDDIKAPQMTQITIQQLREAGAADLDPLNFYTFVT